MNHQYFSALLVLLSLAGVFWESMTPDVANIQILMASMLAVLGLTALANVKSRVKSNILMLLYFVGTLTFSLYVSMNRPPSLALMSVVALSVAGLAMSFFIKSKKVTAKTVQTLKPAKKAAKTESKSNKAKSTVKKKSRKSRSKRKSRKKAESKQEPPTKETADESESP